MRTETAFTSTMNSNISKVTQPVTVEKVQAAIKGMPGFEAKYLLAGSGDGYKKVIEKPYMCQVKDYVERAKNDSSVSADRLIFLAPDRYTARQAAIVCRRAVNDSPSDDMSTDSDFDEECDEALDDYMENGGDDENASDLKEIVYRGSEIFLCKGQEEKDMSDAGQIMEIIPVGMPVCRPQDEYIKMADTVMIEYGTEASQEDIYEQTVLLENPHVYISITGKGGDFESLISRLNFEKNYEVIEVASPKVEEYMQYAEDYIKLNEIRLHKNVDLKKAVIDLKNYRGRSFSEQDIYVLIKKAAVKAAKSRKKYLEAEDFMLQERKHQKSAEDEMARLIGLSCVKEEILKQIQTKDLMAERELDYTGNMIFSGNPGVGKSETARLMARILLQRHVANGAFIDVSRTDLIGKYVGQTAPKVRKAFEKARGGVLFVDEASFLIPSEAGRDPFINEAVTEFIRYMELFRDVMVIFATYPGQAEELMKSDPGFSSRISKVIEFPDYSKDELFQILCKMAEDRKFHINADAREAVSEHIDLVRKNENFGNAREMRKLLEASIEEYAVSMYSSGYREKEADVIGKKQILEASARITKKKPMSKVQFGFVTCAEL